MNFELCANKTVFVHTNVLNISTVNLSPSRWYDTTLYELHDTTIGKIQDDTKHQINVVLDFVF